jgi:putative transposase
MSSKRKDVGGEGFCGLEVLASPKSLLSIVSKFPGFIRRPPENEVLRTEERGVTFSRLTRRYTDAWVSQQLREATPFGQTSRFLILDRDNKYGDAFARVGEASSIEILRTPYRASKANAICERFLGSVRRECLDHMLILGESHLYRGIKEYTQFFNQGQPHQGINQKIPERSRSERKEERK